MRFSLRTALAAVTVLCVCLGIVVVPARRQRSAVRALLAVYAEIQYDCDTGPRQTSRDAGSIITNCLHSVVWMVLDAQVVTDDTLAHLESLPHLRVLMITEGSAVSSSGLVHLQAVPNLRHLVLASGTIDDQGLAYVATLKHLEYLDIYYLEHISDAGIQHLAALKQLNRLRLYGTAATEDGVRRLQSSLPRCEIDWDPEPLP